MKDKVFLRKINDADWFFLLNLEKEAESDTYFAFNFSIMCTFFNHWFRAN